MKVHQISFEELAAQKIPTPYDAFIDAAKNVEIQSSFIKHYSKIHNGEFSNIIVSISGGADSDRVIDLVERIGYQKSTSVRYVFFDTGMEYKATKDHLDELEQKYGVKIERFHAMTPVAVAVKKYGYPFVSKQVSENIYRLQKHGFKFEDRPFEELLKEYPRCKSALRWWCNLCGEKSQRNICHNKWLKEFLVAYPPQIKISKKCCIEAKEKTAQQITKKSSADLSIVGLRKAEGGSRFTIKSCFSEVSFGCSTLRILFWFKKADCEAYDDIFDIHHSCCYSKYGLDRTGCACCPFGKYFERELEAAKKYEPALYRLAMMVFAPSYEYTRKYREFATMKNGEERRRKNEAKRNDHDAGQGSVLPYPAVNRR